jgi:C4-dicarboxylate-specific signal transduction histidine kinase
MPDEIFFDLWHTIKKGEIWKGEIKNRAKDGSNYWVYSTITAQYDKDNNIYEYISIRQDITAQKKLNEANHLLELSMLQTANESMKVHHLNITLEKRVKKAITELRKKDQQLLNQSKLAIMGEMLAMIAHQWQQPLNILSLNLADLELFHTLNSYPKKEIDYIIDNSNKNIDYMAKTINDFKEFLKPNSYKEDIKISNIFNQLKSLITTDIKKYNIKLDINFYINKDKYIKINISKFTQVIVNIIKNSIDAFKQNNINDKLIIIDIKEKNKKLFIDITDNAGGIDKNFLANIFEPYTTTKGKNGTGLGMYMSKLIMQNHLNGDIIVSSTEGNTTFIISIDMFHVEH